MRHVYEVQHVDNGSFLSGHDYYQPNYTFDPANMQINNHGKQGSFIGGTLRRASGYTDNRRQALILVCTLGDALNVSIPAELVVMEKRIENCVDVEIKFN